MPSNVLQMFNCLHYRIYQVLTPHIASPRVMNWGLSWGLINHIQAYLSPSLLVLLVLSILYSLSVTSYWLMTLLATVFDVNLVITAAITAGFCLTSIWLCIFCLLQYYHCHCLYATFFCCTIVISVIGSLGFLTVVLNDITPLLSPVFYIITCLYLECLFLDLSSGTMVILSSLPVKKCVQPTHPGCALEKLVGKLEGKAPRRRLYFWFLFCSLLFCLGLR